MLTRQVRGIWLAIVVLASLLAAAAAGALSYLAGDPPARAVITASAAFTATLALAVSVLAFLSAK
jgi:hypothetical protein